MMVSQSSRIFQSPSIAYVVSHRRIFLSLIIFIMLVFCLAACHDPGVRSAPKSNDGNPWRIAYYEGGEYFYYQRELEAIAIGLMETGWVEKKDPPELPDEADTKALWEWMSRELSGEYLEFVDDAYWSAEWRDDIREANRMEAIERLSHTSDINLVFTMGTWAGVDLAVDDHGIPTIVISTSDPIKSNIIECAEDSGRDHVIAMCDPQKYIRQLRMFHTLIGFERLGVVYEDTPDGRVYAALEDIEMVAEERGFEVIGCIAPETNMSEEEAVREAMRCYEERAPRIDAFFVTPHAGNSVKYMPEILSTFYDHDIPTWALDGSELVRRGVLMSISDVTTDRARGLWYAETIGRILNGAQPRDLNQVFESPKIIAINLEAASLTGYDPPASILSVADEIYETISVEEYSTDR